MTRALYIAPDPITGKARALELSCGWFPTAPPDLAGVPVPCAVVIGGNGVQTFPEPLTVSAVRAAIDADVTLDAAAAAAQAVLSANEATLRTRGKAALTTNATFLAITTPTTAQNAAQIKALTRQVDGLIRLIGGFLDSVSDS
jgi:hypothetical protein